MTNWIGNYWTNFFDDVLLSYELDWQLLDQLHSVVLQISTFCFRTKQICLTVDVAVAGILFKFTDNRLDDAIFVAGLLIPVGFWFLDSVAYFYQVKLRGLMQIIRGELRERNQKNLVQGVEHSPVIAAERLKKTWLGNAWNALVNHSMWLYGILIAVDLAFWLGFSADRLSV